MKATEVKISVIIPAHNEESCIGDCIKGVLNQSYPNKEVIVVNDGSKDRTSEIAKSLKVKVIDFDRGHSAAFARNAGAKGASGDVLYFLDADVLIKDRDFLSILAEDFKEAEAVGFKFVPDEPKTFIQKCLGVSYAQLPYGDKKKFFSHAPETNTVRGFHAIHRKIFRKLGGFNEDIFYFEDRDLHNKFFSKGYRVLYDPHLVMYSVEPQTLSEFIRQCTWLGRGLYEYHKQTGVLHYRAIAFWTVYLLSGFAGLFHVLPLLLFILMNLALLVWILKLACKSGDIVHSVGNVFLHFIRTVIVSFQFLKLSLSGGGGR